MAEPHLDPEDVPGFTVPTKPSELGLMSDDEMFTLLRHVAFENKWGIDAKVQFEAMARNIAALKDFRRASDRASKILIGQNFVLLVLTAVLIWLTLRLS